MSKLKILIDAQCRELWKKYNVPLEKQKHLELVGKVAEYLAKQCIMHNSECIINTKLLISAALLHDLDKNISKLPEEQHPDTAVRILKQEGMGEVADLVRTHPLHLIIDPATAPHTWEEKILFLADKMVKYDIITVDERFRLWNQERLPPEGQKILDDSYPKVKILENELCTTAGVKPKDIANIV